MPWYHGNMHCHTSNSDAKDRISPEDVASYYQQLGFDFLAITDHNHLTSVEEYGNLHNGFLGIPSAEYSGKKACHVVGFDISENVGPQTNQADF